LYAVAATAQYKQHKLFTDYYAARGIGSERVWQRLYVGIGKHIVSGRAQLHYNGPDSTGKQISIDYDRRLKGSRSFVLHAGTFFPITLFSDNSGLALNIELMGSYAELDYDSIVFYPKAVYDRAIPYLILGVPVSLDLKTGGDVSLSKMRRQMFAIGAGVVTCISTPSVVERRTEVPVTAIPFLKVEAGVFAGLAFKLRGVAYLRNAININKSYSNVFADDEIKVRMRAGYGYHLSLIIMPFSYGWRTEEWY
jgi:hypothetical protein